MMRGAADRSETIPAAWRSPRRRAGNPAGHDRCGVLLAALHVAGEDFGEQLGGIAPHVDDAVVVDIFNAGERQGAPVGRAEMEPVAHVLDVVPAANDVDQKIDGRPLDGATAAQGRAVEEPCRARLRIRIAHEFIDLVDGDGEREGTWRIGRLAAAIRRLEVGRLAERNEAPHLLAEAKRRFFPAHVDSSFGSRLYRSAVGFRPVMPSATRSDRAEMVAVGLAPTAPGTIAPSATYRFR